MNSRIFFVLLAVVVIAVKGSPGIADGLWGKIKLKNGLGTSTRHLMPHLQQMRAFPEAASDREAELEEEPVKEQPVPVKPKVAETKVPKEKPSETPKILETETQDRLGQTENNPFGPGVPHVPIFAKVILGDPSNPKLPSLDALRKVNWRSVETSLELPTKDTMPMVKELVRKTDELLRLFQELQNESNGFVEDIQAHNENAEKEYIGYYN